jgi:hypothetical protein
MPTDLKSDPMPSDLMKEATADADPAMWGVRVPPRQRRRLRKRSKERALNSEFLGP